MQSNNTTVCSLQEQGVKRNELSELWGGIRKGKKPSLEKLYKLFYAQLFNYGYKLTHREALVEDCIQELFIKIWEKRFSISMAESVKSYLFYSFRRILFRRLKKERNRLKRNWLYIEMIPDNSDSIEELLIQLELKKEEEKIAYEMIQSLSERQKEAIKLKYYDGFSNDEIANLMCINKQSVYNHISQAVATLQMMANANYKF